MQCPNCSSENIEGVDVCEQCGQPLSDSHLRGPKSALERALLKDSIGALPTKEPVIVREDSAVGDVITLIAERGTGCAFIANADGKLTGVFSERDALLRIGSKLAEVWDSKVSVYMTPNPQSLKADAKIAFAVHQMDVGHFRHIPIVDNNNYPVGVISVREILSYLTSMSDA
ncbi:MAG: CBS domain-containing protein [Planctomycetales bacterium]|nr:CBS domain-containing protein [Planctomycetales bacterium]